MDGLLLMRFDDERKALDRLVHLKLSYTRPGRHSFAACDSGPMFIDAVEAPMPSHRLILEGDKSQAEWLLDWDQSRFVLETPDGQSLFEADVGMAHRLPDVYELYCERKISFDTPAGTYTFKRQPEAVGDIKAFLETGLRSDDDYRAQLKAQARWILPRGLAMFLIGGSLFALYCWWASWAADPPPGHPLRWFGWLIYPVLLALMGMAIAGPYMCYTSWRQLRTIRRIEQSLADDGTDERF